MTEKHMQTFFGKHILKSPPKEAEVYELKIAKGTSLSFDSIQDHQIEALLKAENDGLYHKITDQPWIQDRPYSYTLKKPFDCFFLKKIKAYVVVWFYKPRERKIFIKIPIVKFLEMRDNSNRKSFTETMAKEAGESILIYAR